jgi:hypothetical protein
MNSRITVLACALLPTVALAAPTKVSLLAGQTLRVAPAFGLLAQAGLAPQVGQPTPPSNLVPTEEPPSLGAVLGFMISGGLVGVTGTGFIIGGLGYLLFGGLAQNPPGGGTPQPGGLGLTATGIAFIVLGLVMEGGAVSLLVHGNGLRVKRNAYNEQHGITDGKDLPPRAPSQPAQPGLAWSF